MTDPVDSLMIDVRANTQGFAQDVAAMRGSFDGQLLDGFAKAGDVLERGLVSALRKGSLGFEDLKRIAFNVIDQIAAQAIRLLFASTPQGGSGGGGLGGLIGSLLGGDTQGGGGGGGSGLGGLIGSILGTISGGSGQGGGGLDSAIGSILGMNAQRDSGGGLDGLIGAIAGMNRQAAPANGLDDLIGAISGIGNSPAPTPGSGGLGALVGAIMGLPGRATGGPVSPERPFVVGERGPELFVPTSAGRIETALPQAPRDVRVAITIAAPPGTSAPQALQRSSRQVASAVRRALGSL
jgi:hypothetical protein